MLQEGLQPAPELPVRRGRSAGDRRPRTARRAVRRQLPGKGLEEPLGGRSSGGIDEPRADLRELPADLRGGAVAEPGLARGKLLELDARLPPRESSLGALPLE